VVLIHVWWAMQDNIAFVCIPVTDAVLADVRVLLSEQIGTPQLEANLSSSGSVIRQMTAFFLFNFFNWHTGMYVFQGT